jgi:hypothetical protein
MAGGTIGAPGTGAVADSVAGQVVGIVAAACVVADVVGAICGIVAGDVLGLVVRACVAGMLLGEDVGTVAGMVAGCVATASVVAAVVDAVAGQDVGEVVVVAGDGFVAAVEGVVAGWPAGAGWVTFAGPGPGGLGWVQPPTAATVTAATTFHASKRFAMTIAWCQTASCGTFWRTSSGLSVFTAKSASVSRSSG